MLLFILLEGGIFVAVSSSVESRTQLVENRSNAVQNYCPLEREAGDFTGQTQAISHHFVILSCLSILRPAPVGRAPCDG